MTPLDTALTYIRRGWNPVAISHRAKGPTAEGWQHRRIDETSVRQVFNGAAMNIGVQLGPTSAGLTDVDLDCAEALALAPYLLPPTKAIFGRHSKPRSHYLYVTTLAATLNKGAIRYKDPATKATLVELRVGGGDKGVQTVFPGSTHESGEAIEWAQNGEPAKADGANLRRAVEALAAGCLLVRGWPAAGGRHDAALVVGGVLARAGWTVVAARQFVGAVAQAAGCENVKAKQDAAESAVKGLAEGVNVYGLPSLIEFFGEPAAIRVAEWEGFRPNATAPEEAVVEAENLDGGVVTQDGVARVFAQRYTDKFRYDHHAGAWFRYDDIRWACDEYKRAFQAVRELGREMREGAKDAVVREVGNIAFASGVERFARADPALAVTSEMWDSDPYLLGTPGGTVNLGTGELRPADPADGITKLTAVAPAKTADCPRWFSFLDETFGGDAEVIAFVQRWAGYCLTGDTCEHALVFGEGSGGNGKSVLVGALAGVMGDYATTASMEVFTASNRDRHPTELARLRGGRLVTVSETTEGGVWDEGRIKQLTGGDVIAARFIRENFFEYRPAFKLFMIGNHRPTLRNVDDAMRRRLNMLSFRNKPPIPDRGLEEKLKAEWPGILRWMIEGCLAWQAQGLSPPATVQESTVDYFDAQDTLGAWLAAECVRRARERLPQGDHVRAVRGLDHLREGRERGSWHAADLRRAARQSQTAEVREGPDTRR